MPLQYEWKGDFEYFEGPQQPRGVAFPTVVDEVASPLYTWPDHEFDNAARMGDTDREFRY